MKIAVFTNNYLPFSAGVPVSIINYKHEMERRKNNVYVFAPRYENYKDLEKNIIRVGSVKTHYNTGFNVPLPFLPEVNAAFNKINPDIIHVQHPWLLGEKGARLAKKHNIPLVFTYHTLYERYSHYSPLSDKFTKRFIKKRVTKFCKECDLIIAPSVYVKDMLKKRKIKTRIIVVPSGISIEEFAKKNKFDIRKKYHLPKNTLILLYAGRIVKEKNIPFLINAFEILCKSNPEAIMILAGRINEEYIMQLKDFIKAKNMQHKIIFTDVLDKKELVRYYQASDIFIFSSQTETQGLVLAEAAASGLPIVARIGPAINEVVKDNYNGFLVRTPRQMAYKIKKLISDRNLKEKFSKNSMEISKNYSVDKMVDILETEFQNLVGNK